jgi:hypothetical protein
MSVRAAQGDRSPAMKPPASMEEIAITSHGSRFNAIVYLAAGGGPHPVVIFLRQTATRDIPPRKGVGHSLW